MGNTTMPWEVPGAPRLEDYGMAPTKSTPEKPKRYGAPFAIATICGTMRLAEDMRTVADNLTRQGYIVLMPHTAQGNSKLAHPQAVSDDRLRDIQLEMIDMASLVVFVTQETRYIWGMWNRGSDSSLYFGESTTAEYQYAKSQGKSIQVVKLVRHNFKDTPIWGLPGPVTAEVRVHA